jgi:hypothetical protein
MRAGGKYGKVRQTVHALHQAAQARQTRLLRQVQKPQGRLDCRAVHGSDFRGSSRDLRARAASDWRGRLDRRGGAVNRSSGISGPRRIQRVPLRQRLWILRIYPRESAIQSFGERLLQQRWGSTSQSLPWPPSVPKSTRLHLPFQSRYCIGQEGTGDGQSELSVPSAPR